MAGLGVRPGVLLVQRRSPDKDAEHVDHIKIKAKHGSCNNEVCVRPRSSFGKSTFHNSQYVHTNKGSYKEEKAALNAIAKIELEVNKISKQVAVLESEFYGGKRVSEKPILNLVEMLMAQLLKLDEIVADGDAKLKRKEQVMRVQRYIEDLDKVKMKNISNDMRSIRPIQRPLIYFS